MISYCNIESKIMLDCNHTMCIKCLKKINETSKKCPFCRKQIKISLTTLNYLLTYGIHKKNLNIVRYALDNRADINWKNYNGNTILHKTVDLNYIDGIKILLEYNASPNIVNNDGYKPIYYSRNNIITKLLHNFNNLNDTNKILVCENKSTINMINEFNKSNLNNVKVIFNDDEYFIEFLILSGFDPYYKLNNISFIDITKKIGNMVFTNVINNIKYN